MSKRRHKSRSDNKREMINDNRNNNNNNMNSRPQYNNPFGINPNQLLSMFGNIDMNQINSMLQSMNTQGFDFNNLNLGNLQNFMGGMGQGSNQRTEKKVENETENINTNNIDTDEMKKVKRDDENIQMLRAIRSIVSGDRAEFIDKIISLYIDGAFDD